MKALVSPSRTLSEQLGLGGQGSQRCYLHEMSRGNTFVTLDLTNIAYSSAAVVLQ